MKKTIFFDFWGTLVENGEWSPIKQVRNILQIRLPFSEYVVRFERAMMTQNFTTLEEAFRAVFQEFEVKLSQEKLDRLIGMWNKNWMLAAPYEETQEILRKLGQDHKIILISNTDNFSVKNVLSKFDLEKYFSAMFLSCDLKKIKTDADFIQTILLQENLKPEECLWVGDSIQSDMKAAQSAGIASILIDRRNTRNYTQKIKNLRELVPL